MRQSINSLTYLRRSLPMTSDKAYPSDQASLASSDHLAGQVAELVHAALCRKKGLFLRVDESPLAPEGGT